MSYNISDLLDQTEISLLSESWTTDDGDSNGDVDDGNDDDDGNDGNNDVVDLLEIKKVTERIIGRSRNKRWCESSKKLTSTFVGRNGLAQR